MKVIHASMFHELIHRLGCKGISSEESIMISEKGLKYAKKCIRKTIKLAKFRDYKQSKHSSASQLSSSSSFQHTFPPTLSSAQLPPNFLTTMVQAVKAAISATQAPVVHPDIVDFSSEDNVQHSIANSESSVFKGTHALGLQMSSLLGVG